MRRQGGNLRYDGFTLAMVEQSQMAVTLAEIEEQARRLSAEDRARLAEILLESLDETASEEIEAAWSQEIEARVAAFDRGERQTHAADDVFAEARRIAQ